MSETINAGTELWKVGGIAAVLLAILVFGGWLMFRFFTKMVMQLGKRLDEVQDRQFNELATLAKDNIRSNNAIAEASRQTIAMTKQMVDVMRARPCFEETQRMPAHRPVLPPSSDF